jgi:hypothetical protein
MLSLRVMGCRVALLAAAASGVLIAAFFFEAGRTRTGCFRLVCQPSYWRVLLSSQPLRGSSRPTVQCHRRHILCVLRRLCPLERSVGRVVNCA